MPDIMNPTERSALMALIRGTDTKPELIVRRLLQGLGYRYRLHCRNLSGRPDLTFPSRRKVIYVHGCFWHQHPGCPVAHLPASRRDFWADKFRRNLERDARNLLSVQALGWEAVVVWECQTRDKTALGHDVRLMPPAYVKAYVKRNKNDAADAEAICEAVTRPSMRFVPVKDTDQQSVLMLHLRQAVSPTSVQAQEVHGIPPGCAHRQPA